MTRTLSTWTPSLVGVVVASSLAAAQEGNVSGGSPYPLPGGEPSGGGSLFSLVQDPSVLVLLIVAGGLGVVVAERRSSTSIRPGGDDGDDETPDALERRRRRVGTAIGRAADALAAPDGGDAVRAWLDLAGELGIDDPGTATERNLRMHAVDAGLSDADAARLADQFEVLRYGGAATDRREREAIAVLRDLETEYGDDPDDTPATTADG